VPFITTAATLNRQFEEQVGEDSKTWRDVKFTVALLSIEDLDHKITEVIWLAPVVSQPYYASFYARKKVAHSKIKYLWFKELDLCARRERGGGFSCLYDRIKELFVEN
jgi:hypothetical protein